MPDPRERQHFLMVKPRASLLRPKHPNVPSVKGLPLNQSVSRTHSYGYTIPNRPTQPDLEVKPHPTITPSRPLSPQCSSEAQQPI